MEKLKCPVCGNMTLYYRKTKGNYRCTRCKNRFEMGYETGKILPTFSLFPPLKSAAQK